MFTDFIEHKYCERIDHILSVSLTLALKEAEVVVIYNIILVSDCIFLLLLKLL